MKNNNKFNNIFVLISLFLLCTLIITINRKQLENYNCMEDINIKEINNKMCQIQQSVMNIENIVFNDWYIDINQLNINPCD